MQHEFSSTRKTLTHLLVTIIICWFISILFFRIAKYFHWLTINENKKIVAQLENQIEKIWDTDTFNKLTLARYIKSTSSDLKRSKRINKIVEVLQNLQQIDYQWQDSIILSNFSVSLDKMKLEWQASNIALLYYSSEKRNYTSLLDRFQDLSFIEQVQIKQYNSLWGVITFTLTADLQLIENQNA